MGSCPDWYSTIRASRYCPGVKPWEWEDLPWHLVWLNWTIAAENAEVDAQRQRKAAGR